MSSKRAVVGRSVPFDQLLSTHNYTKSQGLKNSAMKSSLDYIESITDNDGGDIIMEDVQEIPLAETNDEAKYATIMDISLFDAVKHYKPSFETSQQYFYSFRRLNKYSLSTIFEKVIPRNPLFKMPTKQPTSLVDAMTNMMESSNNAVLLSPAPLKKPKKTPKTTYKKKKEGISTDAPKKKTKKVKQDEVLIPQIPEHISLSQISNL
jgi:hypothetical protein